VFIEIPLENRVQKCFEYIKEKKQMNLFGLEKINMGPIDNLSNEQKRAYQQGWENGVLMAECILEAWFPECRH
jgi:hypothetical protein